MEEIIKEGEVREIVEATLADFDGGKNIDAVNIDNKPDKSEVRDLLDNLFRLVFPGYFRERSFKYYNPRNSFAVTVEDTFYRLMDPYVLFYFQFVENWKGNDRRHWSLNYNSPTSNS